MLPSLARGSPHSVPSSVVFTGSVSADQRDYLALLNVQADLMQRLDFAVMGGYLIK